MVRFFNQLDDKYIRPIFVYKYKQRKSKMYEVEIGDVIREYKIIEDEMDAASDEEDELRQDTSISRVNRIAGGKSQKLSGMNEDITISKARKITLMGNYLNRRFTARAMAAENAKTKIYYQKDRSISGVISRDPANNNSISGRGNLSSLYTKGLESA